MRHLMRFQLYWFLLWQFVSDKSALPFYLKGSKSYYAFCHCVGSTVKGNQNNAENWSAQWNRVRLPSCGPGFESQAQKLCFFSLYSWNSVYICHLNWNVKRTKINKKSSRDWLIFLKVSLGKKLKNVWTEWTIHAEIFGVITTGHNSWKQSHIKLSMKSNKVGSLLGKNAFWLANTCHMISERSNYSNLPFSRSVCRLRQESFKLLARAFYCPFCRYLNCYNHTWQE